MSLVITNVIDKGSGQSLLLTKSGSNGGRQVYDGMCIIYIYIYIYIFIADVV